MHNLAVDRQRHGDLLLALNDKLEEAIDARPGTASTMSFEAVVSR